MAELSSTWLFYFMICSSEG